MKMVSAPQWLVARCLFIRQGYERGTSCYVHQREKAGRVRCTTPSLTVTLCTYFMSRCSSVPHQISSNGRRFHAHRSAYRLRTVIVTPLQRHRANVYVLPVVVSFMVYKERSYLPRLELWEVVTFQALYYKSFRPACWSHVIYNERSRITQLAAAVLQWRTWGRHAGWCRGRLRSRVRVYSWIRVLGCSCSPSWTYVPWNNMCTRILLPLSHSTIYIPGIFFLFCVASFFLAASLVPMTDE